MPDELSLGIIGDWGTGNWEQDAPPQKVANVLRAHAPQISIHLGDEYYAGRQNEETRFASEWPPGSLHSFALNSNHAMYSGAVEYLSQTLAHPTFASQKRASYFAFYNQHWLFVGLDTAIGASWIDMFMKGRLEPLQIDFLRRLQAAYPGRRVALFTHHGPLALDGSKSGSLWDDVEGALGRLPSLWYYGHTHAVVAYKPVQGCFFRCVGHGAVPYGIARGLSNNASVAWHERQSAGGADAERCLNGGMLLRFQGANVDESFFGEDGSERVSFHWDENMRTR